jgi:ABC-type amino acid transport substrate-binding protein
MSFALLPLSLRRRRPLPAVALLVCSAVLAGSAAFAADEPANASAAAEANESIEVLKVATRQVPPFAIQDGELWRGITVELLERVSAAGPYRVELEAYDLDVMLDAVADGTVDAAAAALTITSEREQRVDFTHPFFSSGLGIAVASRPEMSWFSALGRLASSAFLQAAGALLALLAVVGVLVWLAERRRNEQFAADPLRGVGSGIWWSAVTMTTVGYGDKAPLTLPGRVLGLVWMFASIIIISGFTAAIASALTVGQLEQSIKGLDDLYGKRVLTLQASTSAAFLDERLIRYDTVDSVRDGLAELAAGEADAVFYDQPILRYLVREGHGGALAVLPNVFAKQDYGIALPSGSPLREPLNRVILAVTQEPEWRRMLESYLGRSD